MAKAVSSPANRRWNDREFDRLFKAFPPSGSRPGASDYGRLGTEFGRTADAVCSMWDDAAGLLRGKQGASSQPMRDYVASQGWQAVPDRSPELARIRPNRPAPTPATLGTKAATLGLARRITEAFTTRSTSATDPERAVRGGIGCRRSPSPGGFARQAAPMSRSGYG
jgi:hypothetical protein